jgi:hypothetical protein
MAFFLFRDFVYHGAVDCANKPGFCDIDDWLPPRMRPHRSE